MLGTAVVDGPAPVGDEGVDGLEVLGGGRGETAGGRVAEPVERAEGAGHDDQPAARAHPGREGPQQAGGREVVGLRDGIDLAGRVGLRGHACRGVGEDDIDLAQLGGQCRDGVAVAHVEHAALDARRRRPARHGGRDGVDAVRVAAGQQDPSCGAMRRASRSTSARPSPWLAPVTSAMREAVMA